MPEYDRAMLGWLVSLPGRVLHLGSIEESTRTLPEIQSSMRSIASDTELLQQVARDIAGVAAATQVLPPMGR
jgi:hypothetical protein